MKPTITKTKDVRGRIRGYTATLGQIEATGATPADAARACDELALVALSHGGAVLVLHDLYREPRAATWILEFRHGSWGYRIARPMRLAEQGPYAHCDGQSSCTLNIATRYEAERAMQAHWYACNVQPFVDLLRSIGALADAGGSRALAA